MRIPCGEHRDCENYIHDACDGCGMLDKIPEATLYAMKHVSEFLASKGMFDSLRPTVKEGTKNE